MMPNQTSRDKEDEGILRQAQREFARLTDMTLEDVRTSEVLETAIFRHAQLLDPTIKNIQIDGAATYSVDNNGRLMIVYKKLMESAQLCNPEKHLQIANAYNKFYQDLNVDVVLHSWQSMRYEGEYEHYFTLTMDPNTFKDRVLSDIVNKTIPRQEISEKERYQARKPDCFPKSGVGNFDSFTKKQTFWGSGKQDQSVQTPLLDQEKDCCTCTIS